MESSSADLTVIVPVLNRPHRIIPVVSSIMHSAPEAQVWFITNGEPTASPIDAINAEISEAMRQWDNVWAFDFIDPAPACGNYAKKINYAAEMIETEWLFTGADDLYFHDGWWEATWPLRSNPKVHVIGTNDLGHPRVYALHETSTHSLVRTSYARNQGLIDETGKVLHEGYVHEFIDDELVGTAKYRGAWAFAPTAHVEHMHPVWNKGEWDETYNDQGRRMNESRALYAQRCKLWGGTPI